MSIQINKQMNYKTDNENVSVMKDGGNGYTSLQVRRVLTNGEIEEFQMFL